MGDWRPLVAIAGFLALINGLDALFTYPIEFRGLFPCLHLYLKKNWAASLFGHTEDRSI